MFIFLLKPLPAEKYQSIEFIDETTGTNGKLTFYNTVFKEFICFIKYLYTSTWQFYTCN